MDDRDAYRTCPYCDLEDVHQLIVYPRLRSGSASHWRCRGCSREWSDLQYRLRATHSSALGRPSRNGRRISA